MYIIYKWKKLIVCIFSRHDITLQCEGGGRTVNQETDTFNMPGEHFVSSQVHIYYLILTFQLPFVF